MLLDDAGYADFSITGHPTIRTPNLERLSREGSLSANLIAQFPPAVLLVMPCSPAEARAVRPGELGH